MYRDDHQPCKDTLSSRSRIRLSSPSPGDSRHLRLRDIYICSRAWTAPNKLQLNEEKTSWPYAPHTTTSIFLYRHSYTVGAPKVVVFPGERNLVVFMDQTLSMDHRIQRLRHAGLAQLKNIADLVCTASQGRLLRYWSILL